jgi:hypothetical protein
VRECAVALATDLRCSTAGFSITAGVLGLGVEQQASVVALGVQVPLVGADRGGRHPTRSPQRMGLADFSRWAHTVWSPLPGGPSGWVFAWCSILQL